MSVDPDALEEEAEETGKFIEDLQMRLERQAVDIKKAQEIADDLAEDIRSPES